MFWGDPTILNVWLVRQNSIIWHHFLWRMMMISEITKRTTLGRSCFFSKKNRCNNNLNWCCLLHLHTKKIQKLFFLKNWCIYIFSCWLKFFHPITTYMERFNFIIYHGKYMVWPQCILSSFALYYSSRKLLNY